MRSRSMSISCAPTIRTSANCAAKAKPIPTLWTITKDNREVVEQVGTILLHQHPCFQRLLLDMSIKAEFVDPNFARIGCRQTTD